MSGFSTGATDTLLYDVVDALNLDLFECDRWRGFEKRKLNVGPWAFESNVTAVGHIDRPDLATFFVKVVGSLWLYVVSQKDQPLLILTLDGPTVKLKIEDITAFGAHTLKDTMTKLAPGITVAFEFTANNKWEDVNVNFSDLDQQQPTQNAVAALPSP